MLTNYEKGYIICLKVTPKGNKGGENMFENLRNTLKAEGITQKEYGVLLGISEKTVTNKINGETEFTYPEFKKTMLLFKKYNADFLFAESDPKSA